MANHCNNRKGFTLIETMIVIAIIGMLACVMMLSVRFPLDSVKRKHDIEQILTLDAQARAHSAAGRNVRLGFNINDGTISLIVDSKSHTIRLSEEDRISDVLCDYHSSGGTSHVAVPYGSRGTSSSYAVAIPNRSHEKVWLFVTGLTGQHYQLDPLDWNDEQVKSLFADSSHAR